MLRRIVEPVCANLIGSTGVIEIQAGVIVSGSNGVFTVMEPSSLSGSRVRIHADDLKENTKVIHETREESTRRVLAILGNETLLLSLKELESEPTLLIKDIGDEEQFPYLSDTSWLHQLNLSLKHPSLTIETRRMKGGKHLVAILHHTW